jgi:diacylglycerol kinase family enzyme
MLAEAEQRSGKGPLESSFDGRRSPRAGSGWRRIAAVVNAGAGSGNGETLRDAIIELGENYGLAVNVDLVVGPDIAAAARRAVEAVQAGAADVVAAGGGDGTIRSVAEAVADTGIPLAILPLGTLNHFARDLGIPLDINQAMAAIAAGEVRAVDVGEVNGRLFINNSSIGIYPYLVTERDRRRRTGLSKWAAMALAVLRLTRRFPRRRLRLSAGGIDRPYRTACLFVGNNEYDMNFLSLGRRKLDGGRLHLYVSKPLTPLAFLWFAIRAGLGLRLPELDRLEVEAAEIATRTSRLPVALDGEVEMMAPPLRYRARPAALTVIVPPDTLDAGGEPRA